MTPFRRLCLCLLALLLVPVVPVQAQWAAAATPAPAVAGAAAPGHDCHHATGQPPGAAAARHRADAGAGHGRLPPADCCGDGANGQDCGNRCSCLPAAHAALPPTSALALVAHGHRWRIPGHARGDDPAGDPPKRPPIG